MTVDEKILARVIAAIEAVPIMCGTYSLSDDAGAVARAAITAYEAARAKSRLEMSRELYDLMQTLKDPPADGGAHLLMQGIDSGLVVRTGAYISPSATISNCVFDNDTRHGFYIEANRDPRLVEEVADDR